MLRVQSAAKFGGTAGGSVSADLMETRLASRFIREKSFRQAMAG
jgi:hypothetical protein